MNTKKSTEPVTVAAVIRLTIKGQDIELTHDEAKGLCEALSAIVGNPKQNEQLSKIARDVERIRNRPDPARYMPPVIIEPRPWSEPYHPYWREVWCSTDKAISMLAASPAADATPQEGTR